MYNRIANRIALWQVMRGVRLLDRKIPHWWNKINLTTLDISTISRCVVAQATGVGYGRGLEVLGKHGPGILQGFFPIPFDRRLTRTWVKVIEERREQESQNLMFSEVNKILRQQGSMYRIA